MLSGEYLLLLLHDFVLQLDVFKLFIACLFSQCLLIASLHNLFPYFLLVGLSAVEFVELLLTLFLPKMVIFGLLKHLFDPVVRMIGAFKKVTSARPRMLVNRDVLDATCFDSNARLNCICLVVTILSHFSLLWVVCHFLNENDFTKNLNL